MAKYTKDTVQAIPDSDIAKELLAAQQENIATGNPDVHLITLEIGRRLSLAAELAAENLRLKESTSTVPTGQGGWKDNN